MNFVLLSELTINDDYRDAVPRPDGEDYDRIRDSIESEGIRDALLVNDDYVIIDGHTRYDIAVELGLNEVPIRVMSFDDDYEEFLMVIKPNLERRHLSINAKAVLGAKLVAKYEGRHGNRYGTFDSRVAPGGHSTGESAELAGDEVGVGKTSIKRVKFVEDSMKSDDPTVSKAASEVYDSIKSDSIGIKPAELLVRDVVKAVAIRDDESDPRHELADRVITNLWQGGELTIPAVSKGYYDYDAKSKPIKVGNLVESIDEVASKESPRDVMEVIEEALIANDDDAVINAIQGIEVVSQRIGTAQRIKARLTDPFHDDYVVSTNLKEFAMVVPSGESLRILESQGFNGTINGKEVDLIEFMDSMADAVFNARDRYVESMRVDGSLFARLHRIINEEE